MMQITFNCISHKKNKWLKKTGFALATLSLSLSTVYAATTFDKPDANFRGQVSAMGVNYPGAEVNLNGRSFTPGQEIILLQNGQALTQGPLKADNEGNFSTSIKLPADAQSGQHSVVVQAANPSAAAVFKLKVSTQFPESGQDKFSITSERLVPGVYQSAYSAKNQALFVTSAVGRPPVTESQLLKVDPKTLKIVKSVVPAAQAGNDKGQVQAVYGVAVDDANGNVWVTNTRSSSLAVYTQKDLTLVKQFDDGIVSHGRDVAVDTKNNRVYVSTPGAPTIAVFDSKKLEALPSIELKSTTRESANPLSLTLDADAGKLYTVTMGTNELFVIDLKNNTSTAFALPGVTSSSGVAVDSKRNQVYVAAQGSDNVLIVDAKDGKVLHNVEVGAGALNVTFDPVTDLAYVAIRGAGTVAVINPEGKVQANLNMGSYPNHIALDGKGAAYVLNKSQGKDDPTADRISRVELKK